ncbi:hypothetical protein FOCC_FOCC011581 [Frankliniella occidentalis]|uniref:Uncharacterized protein LOC127750216 n=1 Tax=Frankliniella occidentalis TaxID=133901 RepID=A0A9C6XQ59_FRAOC|nr:uncharacterized protein LOC127750216 [Frankliniella occidentalis]KAE8742843.1 hypothetical protein FOCC_FOCC011581 [Frankliniella occidentalis]
MDRKTVKRRCVRVALRDAGRRVQDAELVLELQRNQNEESEESDDGIRNDNNAGEARGNSADENDENQERDFDVQEQENVASDQDLNDEADISEGSLNEEEIIDGPNIEEQQPQQDPEQYVYEQIVDWVLAGGVTMTKVEDLLKRLKPVHPNLPLTYKTLLQTPKRLDVVDCGNGSLWYYGITPQLHRVLSNDYFANHNEVAIDINIDSLPIFNKSKTNFIPILGRLVNIPEPFIIGIFCGCGSDPSDMSSFLEKFVDEVNMLKDTGFVFNDRAYPFSIRHYILDQKARASIKCVKGVRGYYCCEKCTVKGIDYMNRMCLLDQNCPLRTDESFIDMATAKMMPNLEHYDDFELDEHVIGVSPLLSCEEKLVSKFRLDSMHLVYKGVFLRWFDFLWNTRKDYSLTPEEKREISTIIGSFREYCPCDFNRKPFPITSEKLKATELRRMLLYDGVVAFRNLDQNIYKSFLLLHCAIYILCSPIFHRNLNEEANFFLQTFVTHAEQLFGAEFIVYNVHSLLHLAAECNDHGPLDEFGAFPFENCLGMIKSHITSRVKPLQQIAKREMERIHKTKSAPKPKPAVLQMPTVNNPNEQVAGQQFKKILLCGTTVAVKKSDSCCITTDGFVIIVDNIINSENGPILSGKKFYRKTDLYEYPVPSSLLGIFKVSDLQLRSVHFSPENIKHKCYLMPLNHNEFAVVPLSHSF